MSGTQTYEYWYRVVYSDSAVDYVVQSAYTGGVTLNDTQDSTPGDGSTNLGQWMSKTTIFGTEPINLIGFNSAGNPVWLNNNPDEQWTFVASPTPLTIGDTIGFNKDFSAYTYCFAPGTGIATPTGEVAVERLSIGDPILTADGRVVPVRWIGRQTVSKLFAGDRAQPVRIAAGALGDGLPHADLTVTADHGMILDGLVINAGALVNGTTITLVPLADLPASVTYYHVETEDHDVILANGAPAETFVDYAGRAVFDNHAEYLALYGADRGMAEIALPRITTARQLPAALRTRLGMTSAA